MAKIFSGDRQAIDPRAYKVEEIQWGQSDQHSMACMSIESDRELYGDPKYHPRHWHQDATEKMQDADLVFLPYFPPELEQTVYRLPWIGRWARELTEADLSVYKETTEIAETMGKQVAVADIANKISYVPYEYRPQNYLGLNWEIGVGSITPSSFERYVPTATDARRMFTARAIGQTAAGLYPSGARFLYIAAPAHVTRVKKYLTEPWSYLDRCRYGYYQQSFPGLDKATRIYEHTVDQGWVRIARRKIV